MKKILCFTCSLVMWLLAHPGVLGNHIVGGELQMKQTGGTKYEVSLIQFWDSNNLIIPTANTSGNRDPSAELYIYSKRSNAFMDRVTVIYRSTSSIAYQNKACATIRQLQTVTGIYTGSVDLSPQKYNDSEGYYMVWERCCRNGDINNIVDPGENGMVFYLEFPPTTVANSSPEFLIPNGQYICINKAFTMSMSATDVDGDLLRYSLVSPLRGTTSPGQPFGTSAPKTVFPLVTWANTVSLSNVIPGPRPLAVDQTGALRVTASNIGLYVFTVQCEEFRNGKKIGLVRRDFQLLVIDCNDDTPAQPVVMFNAQPTSEVKFCPEKPIELETAASTDWSYQWQLNGLNIPGANGSKIMVKDTGSYSVVKSFTKKCSRDTSSATVRVRFQDPLAAVISASKPVVCKGETLTLLANNGVSGVGLQYSWMLDNVALPGKEPKLEIAKGGIYRLTVTDPISGCVGNGTDTIGIESISIVLPKSVSVNQGNAVTLSPEVTPDLTSNTYQWSPLFGVVGDGASLDLVVVAGESFDYSVKVTSKNGCTDADTIHVNVIDKIHIPSAFSPDNDGHNDKFEIFNAKDQVEMIRIYNRWGEVIFSSDGYEIPWDGTYKDKQVPAGVYSYTIKIAGSSFKGEVLLLR